MHDVITLGPEQTISFIFVLSIFVTPVSAARLSYIYKLLHSTLLNKNILRLNYLFNYFTCGKQLKFMI